MLTYIATVREADMTGPGMGFCANALWSPRDSVLLPPAEQEGA